MKKTCCGIFLVLCTIILCGCNSFEIQGLDRFNENDCCFGLNYGLLPEGQDFLSDFLYEDGDYRYKRNNYGKAQAKTFVMLQYPEYVYQEVKAVCQNYFVFSDQQYHYENFVLFGVNVAGGDTTLRTTFPGFRMFGYNDDTCSVIFVGYLNESSEYNQIAPSDFASFFETQFGEYW